MANLAANTAEGGAEGFTSEAEESVAMHELVFGEPKGRAELAMIFGPELPRVLRLTAARLRAAGPHWSARVEELEQAALLAEAGDDN